MSQDLKLNGQHEFVHIRQIAFNKSSALGKQAQTSRLPMRDLLHPKPAALAQLCSYILYRYIKHTTTALL